MARPLRIQYSGAVYHVTCRGNERKEIFKDDRDRETFLEILTRSSGIYNIKIFSYILMDNHFHLLIETPLGNLGEFMRHFNITYTGYYNRRHNRVGHLYQGRYKSILVDKESYLSVLSRYIHLNPVRTEAMEKNTDEEKIQHLQNYTWSSLPGYINKARRKQFVDYEMVLEEYGGDNDRGRLAYRKRIYDDISKKLEIKDKVIGQSIIGGEEFIRWVKEELLEKKMDRECPSLKEIQRYGAKEKIIEAIEKESGKGLEEIKREKGSIRQIVMDLLYRAGGLKGVDIGELIGVDYSTVSQGRKRLREIIEKDSKLKQLVNQIEGRLSK
jgi:REP element-mobilizing transposase RayT